MIINDLSFEVMITREILQHRVNNLAAEISKDYQDKTPVLLPILNGSFMFAADLIREFKFPCKVSFVKTSSYAGTSSTGTIKTLIGLEESLFNQDILVIEDIIDTGLTLKNIVEELKALGTRSVEVAALFRKKPAREKGIQARYIGFELEDEFILGYGLDYDGLGRNLTEIYKTTLNPV